MKNIWKTSVFAFLVGIYVVSILNKILESQTQQTLSPFQSFSKMKREKEFKAYLLKNGYPLKYAEYCKIIEKALGDKDMDKIIL